MFGDRGLPEEKRMARLEIRDCALYVRTARTNRSAPCRYLSVICADWANATEMDVTSGEERPQGKSISTTVCITKVLVGDRTTSHMIVVQGGVVGIYSSSSSSSTQHRDKLRLARWVVSYGLPRTGLIQDRVPFSSSRDDSTSINNKISHDERSGYE